MSLLLKSVDTKNTSNQSHIENQKQNKHDNQISEEKDFIPTVKIDFLDFQMNMIFLKLKNRGFKP